MPAPNASVGSHGPSSPHHTLGSLVGGGSQQVPVFSHPVAVAPDVDDMAMVQQAVDESRRHYLVAEHMPPLLEALVRGQHRRGPFASCAKTRPF